MNTPPRLDAQERDNLLRVRILTAPAHMHNRLADLAETMSCTEPYLNAVIFACGYEFLDRLALATRRKAPAASEPINFVDDDDEDDDDEPLAPQSAQRLLQPGHAVTMVYSKAISEQLDAFLEWNTSPIYRLRDFRSFCEPFVRPGLRLADFEIDCDNRPKWHGRFDYAHKQYAKLAGIANKPYGHWTKLTSPA